MNDEPQMRLAPGAIVSMANDQTPHFVLQSPHEIRALRAVLREEQDMGLDEGDADESGLIQLVGIDLYSDGDTESYDLSVHPAWLLTVKQVTPRAWKAHQVSVGIDPEEGRPFREVERQQVRDTPKFIKYLMAAGVEVHVLGNGQYEIHLDSSSGPIYSGGHIAEALPLMSADIGDGEQVCCCKHPASAHALGSHVVEFCQVCGPAPCGIFHRHIEDQDERDEEQPSP